jgi:hypothetical protein
MMMRYLLAVVLTLAASPVWAFDTPRALVEAIYAPYQTLGAAQAQDPAQYYSERLRGLVAANAMTGILDEGDAPEVLDFNPFIDGTQSLLRDVVISDPVVARNRALVSVSFQNFDAVSLLSLSLVQEADGWRVDDIASMGDGENWLLSWLLQFDPYAQP